MMNPPRIRTLGTLAVAVVLGMTSACRAPQQQDKPPPPEDTTPAISAWDDLRAITLPQGTVLRCAVAEDLDVHDARVGTGVTLIATERLVLDGVEIILPGTQLQARVKQLSKSRGSERAMTLTLELVSIEATSGALQDCPARPIRVQLAAGSLGLSAGTLLDVFLRAPVDMPLPQGI